MTVDSTPDAKMPEGRYFHGADIQHSKQNIFVYGGMTGMSRNNSTTDTILDDFWKFSIANQRWRAVEIRSSLRPPPLAGHTLTLIKDGDLDILILIGGFSPINGFNHLVYIFNLTTSQWSVLKAIGTSPIGIFGHSTVFHTASQSIYVFGGYAFQHNGRNEMSNRLFALNIGSRLWSELPIFSGINHAEENLPRARFLHSAISTDNFMLVYGGRTSPQNSSDLLIAYVYKCNMWVRLTENIDTVGQLKTSYAQGMAYDSDAVYIVTGWDGSINSRVIQMNLPSDLCELFSGSKHLCRHFMGCSFCTIKPYNEPITHCYSNDRTDICTESEKQYNKGISCDAKAINGRLCSAFSTCESCTAIWSSYSEVNSPCYWCQDTLTSGRCLPLNSTHYCGDGLTKIETNDMCPATRCSGDCGICLDQNCHWSRDSENQGKCIPEQGRYHN